MDSVTPAHQTNTGKSILRNEDPTFLTGTATYVDDLDHPALANAAHVVFVRSVYAHAGIVSVDLSEALQAPGVIAAVASGENLPRPPGAYASFIDPRFAQPFLAHDKVRYVGEAIAVVVAETRPQVVDAAELMVVEYD